jgi:surface-anchored protein
MMKRINERLKITTILYAAIAYFGTMHESLGAAPIRISTGHVDIGFAVVNGEFELEVHSHATDTEYPPDEAILVVEPGSYTTVPDDLQYFFLGLPCSGIWTLPQTQRSDLLFLGFGAEEIESGVFQGDVFKVELKSVSGPGNFFVYDIDSFGTPIVYMNSKDGIGPEDSRSLVAGAHNDLNWTFSQPGTYKVAFEATGTLANGTLIDSGPVDYTFEVNSTNSPPVILYNGHADIGFVVEAGEWELEVHDHGLDAEFEPDQAIFLVRSNALTRVPNDARYSFLAASCSQIWILPQTQDPDLVFLGFGAEELESGVLRNDEFKVELKAKDGPGDFFVYDIDSFGAPVVYMNTKDGITAADSRMLVAGAHNDLNWAFTKSGIYKISFEASGTLANGTFIASGPVEYTFCVEASAPLTSQPRLSVRRSNDTVTLKWQGETGVTYTVESTSAFPGGWAGVGAAIPGICGTQTAALTASGETQFYRLKTTTP